MKRLALAVLASLGFVSPADAQWYSDAYKPLYEYRPYVPYTYKPYTYSAPRFGSAYDWRSGNSYNWNRTTTGTTYLRGWNLNTGSNWQTTIQPNGSMTGLDKDLNFWSYDAQSKVYTNTNGTICVGEGLARTCF